MAKSILEIMEARISTRSFDGLPLAATEQEALRVSMARYAGPGPFGRALRFALVAAPEDAKPVKMGTYGLIAGASAFVAACVKRGPGAMEDLGRATQALVLDATAAGLASCWIGGVFSRGKAAQALQLQEDEVLPVVIALGHPAAKRSLSDRFMAGASRARTRKPFEELVFELAPASAQASATGPGAPELVPVNVAALPETLRRALGMVRIAPSAQNRQSWRLVRLPSSGGADWLFCMEENKVYNSILGEVKLQNIDIGIAMYHFEAASRELGLPGGTWLVPDSAPAAPDAPSASDAPAYPAILAAARKRGWTPVALWRT